MKPHAGDANDWSAAVKNVQGRAWGRILPKWIGIVCLAVIFGLNACATVQYSPEPMDWDQKKLDIRVNVLTLDRKDESDDPRTMECLDKKTLRLNLDKATSFLIEELQASQAYRDVALSSGEHWVRTGELLVEGTINRLGQSHGWMYLGEMHWKVTIPSSRRILWEGNTQYEAEKEGIFNYHAAKVCSELLRQNFFQLRTQLAMVLPDELKFKDRRAKVRRPAAVSDDAGPAAGEGTSLSVGDDN